MNPFYVLDSMFQYFSRSPNPAPTHGGSSSLIWVLAYLAWVNSNGSRCTRRRRHTRSRSCMYTRHNSPAQGTSAVETMDTISEEEEHRVPLASSSLTAERSPSLIVDARDCVSENQQKVQHRYNLRKRKTPTVSTPAKSSACYSGNNKINPHGVITLLSPKKRGLCTNSSDESYKPTLNKRRNKVAPKRIQKRIGRRLKKKNAQLKGCRNKNCEHGTKRLCQRFINIHNCCCCCHDKTNLQKRSY